jgi:surfactin synthase thioesterase subunit
MSAATTASFLRFGATDGARRRLVCLPFAGGGAASYRLWPQGLPDDVEVAAVQLPGREGRRDTPALASVEQMVAVTLAALEHVPDLPLAIFGHSLGALVAFELTVALESRGGAAPTRLFVSGRRAPDEPCALPPVHGLPDEQFLDAMQERYGGVPEVVRREPDLLALLLPALRADVRAFETYAPLTDRRVRCPVHVYGGLDDTRPRPDELGGWQRVAERDVTVKLFPGDHFYLASQHDALTAEIAGQWSDAPITAERT